MQEIVKVDLEDAVAAAATPSAEPVQGNLVTAFQPSLASSVGGRRPGEEERGRRGARLAETPGGSRVRAGKSRVAGRRGALSRGTTVRESRALPRPRSPLRSASPPPCAPAPTPRTLSPRESPRRPRPSRPRRAAPSLGARGPFQERSSPPLRPSRSVPLRAAFRSHCSSDVRLFKERPPRAAHPRLSRRRAAAPCVRLFKRFGVFGPGRESPGTRTRVPGSGGESLGISSRELKPPLPAASDPRM